MTLIIDPIRSPEQVLGEVFSRAGQAIIRPLAEGGWSVRRAAKALPEVHVDVCADGWSLRAPLALVHPTADQCWETLKWNHLFHGGAKLVLQPDGTTLGLRAEFPVDDEVDPAPLVWQAFDGLVGAVQLTRRALAGQPAPAANLSAANDRDAGDLEALCVSSEWSCHARGNGFAMTLETPAGFHQAIVEQDLRWGVVARLELHAVPEMTEVGRHATGRFLLEASRFIRFARAIRCSLADGKHIFGFEVLLGWNATPKQLSSALAALSVACRLCAHEIESLGNERIACAYLRLRGASL